MVRKLFEKNFIQYASYVILDRAIPAIDDGLKPVQRRILYTLYQMSHKLHKVANVVGQTMALHPHGDASIKEALVNLANKNYLLKKQGNFGNLLTGDPAAAARYIEAGLEELAKETLFNNQITSFIPSYDGRTDEPFVLPVKIPLLLMHGAEGIAVGMSTRIFPHNFRELLEAQIAILEGKSVELYPDFPTGGIMDVSEYDHGRGKIKLRAKMEELNEKTLVIREICYGTTTESLIDSIDDAAKKGKIKIESIDDYTAQSVEIHIKLPRGQYAKNMIASLYAFTDCEVSLNSQIVAIKDNLPWEGSVEEVLQHNTFQLKDYLEQELKIKEEEIEEKIFDKTLEQIFIEYGIYKKIENVASYEKIHEVVALGLKPHHDRLSRIPSHQDREHLLALPIRRISKFDIQKNEEDIVHLGEELKQVRAHLKNMIKFTISYIKTLLKKYGAKHSRNTDIQTFNQIDIKSISTKNIKVGFDMAGGYVGTKVSSDTFIECTNYDKLLILFDDGTYVVKNIGEKDYVSIGSRKVVFVGIADKKTLFSVVYSDAKSVFYAKKFVVKQFILDKVYSYLPEKCVLQFLETALDPVVDLELKGKEKSKAKTLSFLFSDIKEKGVTSKGIRISSKPIKKIKK